ncbi:hypothetical protein [Myroides pelagicus]|uniref:Uncharacterized protein n=1 Tax=Myroides pelagicus TaxID=270914 RepID=A0A7K1GHA2_9FLAO|nr:hypothetical protein [Myroides pelagicus]MTH28391.1 hypothetical protein [Myroides pelagicus]
MKLLFYILILTFLSCGARKVNLETKTSKQKVNNEVVDKTKVKELVLNKDSFSNLIYELDLRADSIIQKGSDVIMYNPSVKSKREIDKVEKEEIKNKVIDNDVEVKQNETTEIAEKDKVVDRKQFNWLWVILPVSVIGLLAFKYRKYFSF